MKIKTSNLAGAALDWVVTSIELARMKADPSEHVKGWVELEILAGTRHDPYSIEWMWAGPIIERENISVQCEDDAWSAYFRDKLWEEDGSDCFVAGPTPLIAAMRCFVSSKLGAEVEVPYVLVSS